MSYLPILKFNELQKILKRLGYLPVRQKGSHVIFSNQSKNTITVPNHPSKTIGKGLLRKLIGDLDIDVSEFIKIANS